MLEVIHISDTHIGPDRSLDIRGSNVCARTEALVAAINNLPFTPDFVIHTGDVVNDPDVGAYRLSEELLSKIEAPVYYVTGNHDDVPMMRDTLSFGEKNSLVPESLDQLCYQVGGAAAEFGEFFVIDGKVPPEDGPHGHISAEQLDAVLGAITGTKPVAIFIHFPLSPIGSRWIDDHLLVTNGLDFQSAVAEKAGSQLRGIFSGHLHRGIQLYRDGVLQSGVSSPACEFTAGPEDDFCDFLSGAPVPFHHITFTEEATVVKAYTEPFCDPS